MLFRSLAGETLRILKVPQVAEALQRLGMEPDPLDPDAFAAKIRADIARYAKVAKAAGMQPQ